MRASKLISDPWNGRKQVLSRICYILEVLRTPAAVAPAIDILRFCAMRGRRAARAVLLEPRLITTLLAFFELYGQENPKDPLAGAHLAAQSKLLVLFKELCRVDRSIAATLLSQGTFRQSLWYPTP